MSYMHAIGMKTLSQSLKNTFLTILHVSGHFRPIPVTYRINKNQKNHEISQKNEKMRFFENRYFVI